MPLDSKYVIDLLTAQTPGDVDEIVEEIQASMETRLLPVGGAPKTAWDEHGQPNGSSDWNNRCKVKIVENSNVALMERIRNGHDASIILYGEEVGFKGKPNYEDAAAEVAAGYESARVFLITSDNGVGGCRIASVVDENGGIAYYKFGESIMASGSTNKVRNRRVAGNLGIGGLQSLAFTERTVIVSRLKSDRNQLAVTVAWKIEDATTFGEKSCSYVWLCDVNGHALLADASEIEHLCAAPSMISNANFDANIMKPILPAHGTHVRMVDYPLGSNTENWHMLREIGWGVPMLTTLLNGLSTQRRLDDEDIDDDDGERTGKKRVFHVNGLRFALDRWTGNRERGCSVVYSQPPVSFPIDSENRVSISVWVLRGTDKAKKAPVQTLIPAASSGIVISVDGQLHATLPDKLLLDRANLGYLDDALLIEVKLDQMKYSKRNDWILVSREKLEPPAIEMLKDIVLKFIRADDNLHRWNEKFRDERIVRKSGDHGRDVIQKINRLLANPLSGPLRSRFGGAGTTSVNDVGPVKRTPPEHTPRPFIDVKDTPTWIKLRKGTIEPGSKEWCVLTCNATEVHNDRITFDILEGTSILHTVLVDGKPTRKGLRDGRDAFLLECDKGAKVGDTGLVRATLTTQDGTVLPPAIAAITVVERAKEPRKKQMASQPLIEPEMTRPGEPSWQNMKAGDAAPEDIAFNLLRNGEKYDCLINEEMAAFVSALNDLKQRGFSHTVLDAFRDDFQVSCVIQALNDLVAELPADWTDGELHSHRQSAVASQLFLRHDSLIQQMSSSRHKAA